MNEKVEIHRLLKYPCNVCSKRLKFDNGEPLCINIECIKSENFSEFELKEEE